MKTFKQGSCHHKSRPAFFKFTWGDIKRRYACGSKTRPNFSLLMPDETITVTHSYNHLTDTGVRGEGAFCCEKIKSCGRQIVDSTKNICEIYMRSFLKRTSKKFYDLTGLNNSFSKRCSPRRHKKIF